MDSNTKICPNCGTQTNAPGYACCANCGAMLKSVESENTIAETSVLKRPIGDKSFFVEEQLTYKKNYLLGGLFAFVGAMIGAAAWAIVGSLGYIVGWIGFLIAFLAAKFYDFSKTRATMAKFWIVIVCVIIGVAVGEFVSVIIIGYNTLNNISPLLNFSIGEVITFLFENFSEFSGGIIQDLALGYVFAFFGSLSILREVKANSIIIKSAEENQQYTNK